MKNLIIIPARKGSKRIKDKNLVKILNQPLISWTINYAKKFIKKNCDLIVTSDCMKIKKICYKQKILFLKRPKKISSDNASMHEVIFHVLNNLDQKYRYIILLQPTSPLRKLNLIPKSINILDKKKKFDSLIHLARCKSFTGEVINNHWKPDYNLKNISQNIKSKFSPTGNIFMYRYHLYEKKIRFPKKTYSLVSKNDKWIDIDYPEDLIILDSYLKDKKNRKILIDKE